MTDLIPRDAVIAAVTEMIDQANKRGLSSVAVIAMSCRQNICAIPAIDPAAIREAALETPEFSRLVEEAKNAVEVLRFAVTEIQDLENTLSSYRQNWTDADAAANSLSAAILALIGEKK